MTSIYGGGTGTSHIYPSGAVGLEDDITPNQPWTLVANAGGAGNPCIDTLNGNLYRYGDYMTVRPLRPTNLFFIAMNYILAADAGACGTATNAAQPHQAIFGRARDVPGANSRWN
jgi:hypothetical protein